MSDDLVERLRKGVMCGDDPIVDEAADRIEKLEEENSVLFVANIRLNSRADLDCDHYRDRIEKLEALVEQLRDDNSSMIDDYDADLLRQEKRIEKLEAALRRIADLTERWEHDLISQANEIARKALEGKDE